MILFHTSAAGGEGIFLLILQAPDAVPVRVGRALRQQFAPFGHHQPGAQAEIMVGLQE